MMNWKKMGRIFKVEQHEDWMHSHTTPIATLVFDDRIRVYFSTRNKQDQSGNFVSNSSFIDVDIHQPSKVLHVNTKPLFEMGKYGCFDEFGVMVTDVILQNENVLLYYAGWQRLGGGTAPYQVMLGIARSIDGGNTFTKISNGPFMSIDDFDPVSIGNVAVLKDQDKYRMYYTSLTDWVITGKKPTYEYRINYAESINGINWQKNRVTCIDLDEHYGVATPCILKHNEKYHMWYGCRKSYDQNQMVGGYTIGYSYSLDGVEWVRSDNNVGINASYEGWDAEMICYPSVVKVNDKLIMFYCGNGFGKEGIGYAECDLNELK